MNSLFTGNVSLFVGASSGIGITILVILICICCCRRHNKTVRKESIGLNHDDILHSRPLEQSPFYAMRPIGDYHITPSDAHMGPIDVFNCSVHGPRQTLHIPEIYAQNHSPYHKTDNKHLYPPTDV
jgi:hypothetical protein